MRAGRCCAGLESIRIIMEFTLLPKRRLKLDRQGRFRDDLPCQHCGYNLRGLDPKSSCPECGVLIYATLDIMARADPQGRMWFVLRMILDLFIAFVVANILSTFGTIPNLLLISGILVSLISIDLIIQLINARSDRLRRKVLRRFRIC